MMAGRFFPVLGVPVLGAAVAWCGGCATTQPRDGRMADARVSVRFVVSPIPTALAQATPEVASSRLVSDVPGGGFADEPVWSSMGETEPAPYHAVLWGGPYRGDDVTHASAPLAPGPYVFGLFDQDLGAAYQGWLQVNQSGDDLASVMAAWRDAVREQKRWLGFDQRISGVFQSPSPRPFKAFRKQVRKLDRLERRIDNAVTAERNAAARRNADSARILDSADVLLMPGPSDFFRPSTRPAFSDAELASVRDGDAMTKVVLLADYAGAVEKLRRVNDLREDLERSREVFAQEGKRLKRLKGYYAITDHLYNHGKKFVQNERRLQEVFGMIEQADRRIEEHRRYSRALTFIARLFSPNDASGAFGDEERSLQRKRVVLEEHKRRFDLKLAQADPTSIRRVTIQRDRQQCIARIEAIDEQLSEIADARLALGRLKDSTSVIHRYGPTRVVTATLLERTMPDYLVDAIERQALMTVRLQTTDSLYAPPETTVTRASIKNTETTAWHQRVRPQP